MNGDMPVTGSFVICVLGGAILRSPGEWEDHDRSQKLFARDLGINYVERVDKSADPDDIWCQCRLHSWVHPCKWTSNGMDLGTSD